MDKPTDQWVAQIIPSVNVLRPHVADALSVEERSIIEAHWVLQRGVCIPRQTHGAQLRISEHEPVQHVNRNPNVLTPLRVAALRQSGKVGRSAAQCWDGNAAVQ